MFDTQYIHASREVHHYKRHVLFTTHFNVHTCLKNLVSEDAIGINQLTLLNHRNNHKY